MGGALLTWNQLQEGIDSVNSCVEDEYERMEHTHAHTHTVVTSTQVNQVCVTSPAELLAVAEINKAVDTGDPQELLAALLLPSGGLEEVLAANASRYLTLLTRLRRRKAQVRPHGHALLGWGRSRQAEGR